jgi:predicted RNA-binding Zn ribbon-like protein
MQVYPHKFRAHDLIGGHVVVDLVNTVLRTESHPVDWFESYSGVLEWAALTGEFDDGQLVQLEHMYEAEPADGALALRRLRELREVVHEVLAATIANETAPDKALRRLEARWKDAVAHARLTISDHHTSLRLSVESCRLDYLNHELALRAFDLLRTFPETRTRVCAGTNCGWLFIDRSKAGRRRWCDMATCGNVAKSRRHYERKRAARSG